MALQNTSNKVQYNCDGVQTEFSFTFPIFQSSDIYVVLTDPDGNETILTENTDYTVTAATNGFENGGKITTASTYASGYTITIVREVPLTQETDFRNKDVLPAETLESGFDKLTMIAQQLEEKINRNIKIPVSDEVTSLELPNKEARAGHFLGFDSNGQPVASNSLGAYNIRPFMETFLESTDKPTACSNIDALSKTNDNLDDIQDGTTYGRVLQTELNSGKVKEIINLGGTSYIIANDDDTITIYTNGTLVGKIYSNGIVEWGKQSACEAKLAADQLVPTDSVGWTKLNIVANYDVLGEFDDTNHRWTCTQSGKYLISASVKLLSLADGNHAGLLVRKNGLNFRPHTMVPIGAAYNLAMVGSAVVELTAGDYLELYAVHNYGADRTAQASDIANYLAVIKIA